MPILERVTTSFSAPGDQVVLFPAHQPDQDTHTASPTILAADHENAAAAAAVEQLDRRCRIVRSARTGHHGRYRAAGGDVDLVVGFMPPGEVTDALAGRAWARLLRPGGILAVLTRSGYRDDRLVDPTGQIVTAARDAGLRYLQHIVALHIPIRHGTLAAQHIRQCYQNSRTPPQQHLRVHADVLVFARPAQPAAANGTGER